MKPMMVQATGRWGQVAVLVGAALGTMASLTGCSADRPTVAAQAEARPAAGIIPDVLATVGDEQITMADIRGRVGDQLDELDVNYRRAMFRIVNTSLEEILQDRIVAAEARAQGKTVMDLAADAAGGSLEPTPIEVRAWFDANLDRFPGRTYEQVSSQIADYLRGERRKDAMEKLQKQLNEKYRVTVSLEPYRLPIGTEGAPSYGPSNAAVTVVEFSDFQCPFCARFYPVLHRLKKDYGDRVRFVYRQLPLTTIHPQAFKAAEASLCAHEQGKFWEIHDLMFDEQQRLGVQNLKDMARRLRLDQRRFDSCLDSGRYAAQVQQDYDEGTKLGINGTPAIFVNGIPIEGGAVPYDVVAKAIDKELERVGR